MTATDPISDTAEQQREYAIQLAARFAFHVFPVDHPHAGTRCRGVKTRDHDPDTCDERGKHPTCKWSQWSTTDVEQLTTRHYFGGGEPRNIAIDCGKSRLLVLDEDEQGELARFCRDHNVEVPATLVVRTGSGFHYYFRLPDGVDLGNAEGAFHDYKINVRGVGGYVVAPGSRHASGVQYTAEGDTREAAPAPQWLINAVTAKRTNSSTDGTPGDDWWRDGTIPVNKRHKAIVAAAGWCRRMGHSRTEAIPVIRDVFRRLEGDKYMWEQVLGRLDDVYDRYEAGYRGDQLDPEWVDPPSGNHQPPNGQASGPTIAVMREPWTDLGHARRLAAVHGHRLRFIPAWRKWFTWDGRRWQLDRTGEAARCAKHIAGQLMEQAKNITDEKKRDKMIQAAKKAQSAYGIRAMLELAGTEPQIAVTPDDLDAHPHLLNTTTGVLDLTTGQVTAHDPALHLTKITGAGYNPDATAPTFTQFLERVQPHQEMREFLARLLGHTLTGQVLEHLMAILYGTGANGKTTLVEIVRKVLGDYAATTDPGLLIDRGEAHPTGIADLFGLRLAITYETDAGRRLAEGTIKRLTGGDRVKARRMREDFWEFDPTHSITMVTNHRPIVTGDDEGIWRRLRLIPFNVVIPDGEQDGKLPERLELEADGVLAWLVAGYRQYLERGLAEPDSVRQATSQYRRDSDALGRFLNEHCVLNETIRVRSSALFSAWCQWCAAENLEAGTQTEFSTRLTDRGYDKTKTGGRMVWQGIGLPAPGRDDAEAPDDHRL